MLSMLGSVKVIIGKDDIRDYKGAGVKQIIVTTIECNGALVSTLGDLPRGTAVRARGR
ncbi:hypothetical protein GQ44DRAFT_713078 [Phaeosphaeriaceae sp. PMI808]|nr:hypothetical protein GQ44DRAFT_713078 [Phaeosphaeriaceae sp. PMI808]